MSSMQQAPDPNELMAEPEPIRLLAIVNTLLRRRWLIVVLSILTTGAGVGYALSLSPAWTATAKFLPSRTTAMTNRMSTIVGGNIDLDAGEESSDYYVALVQSPAFLVKIVEQTFDDGLGERKTLVEIFDPEGEAPQERLQRATEALGKSITIAAAKGVGAANSPRIVTLTVIAGTGELSASIAEAILKGIQIHNETSRGLVAKQNRTFVEERLKAEEAALATATDALARFSARNRKIATPALQAELDRLELAKDLQRQVAVDLTKQVMLARIQEQESRVSIEILQPPEVPLSRSSPKRTQIVLVAGFLGLMGSSLLAIVLERLKRADPSDPDTQEFRKCLRSVLNDLRRIVLLPKIAD